MNNEEYIDLTKKEGKESFKKEVRIEKYHNPTVDDYKKNAKEEFKKAKIKAKVFVDEHIKDEKSVVGKTGSFLKRKLGEMKENKRRGLSLFGNRKIESGRQRMLGGGDNSSQRSVFLNSGSSPFSSQGRSNGGGVFAMNTKKVETPKKKKSGARTIVIKL